MTLPSLLIASVIFVSSPNTVADNFTYVKKSQLPYKVKHEKAVCVEKRVYELISNNKKES